MADNPFKDLLKKLVRVPKHEIDEKEREYQESRETTQPSKRGEIVTPTPTSRTSTRQN